MRKILELELLLEEYPILCKYLNFNKFDKQKKLHKGLAGFEESI